MEDYEKVWRAFGNTKVSHSVAHYLFAINSLEHNGNFPRAADIAKRLDISRNAVSLQVRSLLKEQYVHLDSENRIHLTPQGSKIVNLISSIRISFKTFLVEVLGVDTKIAEEDSCKVEHLLSETTGAAFIRLIRFIRSEEAVADSFVQRYHDTLFHCKNDEECGLCTNTCLMKNNRAVLD